MADELAGRLSRMYPGLIVAGTYFPPFRPLTEKEDRQVVERINQARPDVLWVGLGCPEQEKWMLAHHGRSAAATVGVGAAFDFHSGRARWARRGSGGPGWSGRSGWCASRAGSGVVTCGVCYFWAGWSPRSCEAGDGKYPLKGRG